MNPELLKDAFSSFLDASKSLENYFLSLQQRINYLTEELEKTNTELKKSLEEKERTNNFLDTVLNSLDESIIVLDRQRNIVMLNRGAEKLLNLDTNLNFIGKPFSKLGVSIKSDGDTQYLIINQNEVPVIYSEYPVKNSKKEERGKIVVIKDISKIKEMESLYERNKRLIAMGEMAAKIIHEIRSPLCSIELFASMLKDESSEEKRGSLIEGISSGIGSLNNILNNMLYFAKERKVKKGVVSIEDFVDDVISLFAPLVEKKQIKIVKKVDKAFIHCDKDLVKQAVFNLLQNAYQAVSEGGVIEVVCKREGKFFVIAIKDNGCGISKECLEKIFDPFFTTKESGTGLGLAITLRIVEAHKGFLKVKSKKNKGSEFKIFLPMEA